MPDLRIVTALPQSLRPAYEALLASAGLRDEGDADCTALLSSGGGALLACGSVSGRVLKQIAVAPWAEGDGACARIVTALLEESARRGVAHPFLYTKPKNARLFRSLGFFPVAETADMLMMEYGLDDRGKEVQAKFWGTEEQRKRWLKVKYIKAPLFLRPFINFNIRYILKGGFLDGKEGFIWHFLQGFWYRFLVDAKIYEIKKRFGWNDKRIKAFIKETYLDK